MIRDDVERHSMEDIERRKKAIALALGLRGFRRMVRGGKRRYGTPKENRQRREEALDGMLQKIISHYSI